ncbi:pilus assembly protein TadG-related protein [Knoellia sp. S7-12]|uniref:pilus assembly protein TadG-related protein n=1 Tax=Knoellia sp. S7-12 TaxID=3126698 RepID=UPI003369045B
MTDHHPTTQQRERGSVTLWLATCGFAMIVVVGLAVDLGGQVQAQQRARSLAAQAARTGGQQLQPGPAIRGEAAAADRTRAVQAARAYLAATDVTGTVEVSGSDTITVTTTDTYATTFLGIIGLNTLTVTGNAQARITRSVEGVEQ